MGGSFPGFWGEFRLRIIQARSGYLIKSKIFPLVTMFPASRANLHGGGVVGASCKTLSPKNTFFVLPDWRITCFFALASYYDHQNRIG